jgi:hypothetical protein
MSIQNPLSRSSALPSTASPGEGVEKSSLSQVDNALSQVALNVLKPLISSDLDESHPTDFTAKPGSDSPEMARIRSDSFGSLERSDEAMSPEIAKNLKLANDGPRKLQQHADTIKKMGEEYSTALKDRNDPALQKQTENIKLELKMCMELMRSSPSDPALQSKFQQLNTRLTFLQKPNDPGAKKAFLGQMSAVQAESNHLINDVASASAKVGKLPSPTITDPKTKKALTDQMTKCHISSLKSDPSHLSMARDYFLGTATLPPPPTTAEGLSYDQNDTLLKSMAEKIRKENLPGGIEKLGGGSGGVYKLSSKNLDGKMEPLFVFKIEDEEPGGLFCRAGFEAGTGDDRFPSDEGLIREEFVNRSPLDPRHATRHTLEHHPAFNSKEGIAMPPRAGMLLPFIKGGKVLEEVGTAKLQAAIANSRTAKNASEAEKSEAKQKIEKLQAEIDKKISLNEEENYGVQGAPSEWKLWDKISTQSGQLVLAKTCAYGNTDVNDGNIMVIGASKPGEFGIIHDFDYGRAVPKGAPEDYGLVTFANASFAKEPVLNPIKGKINALDIDNEVARMRQTWSDRKGGDPTLPKALDQQEEALRAHMNLLKTAVNSGYTLAEVFHTLNSGALLEAVTPFSGQPESPEKWTAFNAYILENTLPSVRQDLAS